MIMYLVQLGREINLPVDTLIEGMAVAVNAFKRGWEVDVINVTTGEVMLSLRDGEMPYFSTSIHEVVQTKRAVHSFGQPAYVRRGLCSCQLALCTNFVAIFCVKLLLVFFPKCDTIIIESEREVKRMEELKTKNMIWIVINPDGTYAGVPCLTWKEARELVAQKEGRRVFNIDPIMEDVTESKDGLLI